MNSLTGLPVIAGNVGFVTKKYRNINLFPF